MGTAEKHLKWRLMNGDGLSEAKADKRIKDMKDFQKKVNKKKRKLF